MPRARVLHHLLSTTPGLTQNHLAAELGMHKQSIQQMAAGSRPVPAAIRVRLDELTAKGEGDTIRYVPCIEAVVLGEVRFYILNDGRGRVGYCVSPEWADRMTAALVSLGYRAGAMPHRDSAMAMIAHALVPTSKERRADHVRLDAEDDPNATAYAILRYLADCVDTLTTRDPIALGEVEPVESLKATDLVGS